MKTLLLALACSAVALPACVPVQKIVAKAPGATATVLPTRDHEARGTVTFTRKGRAVVIAGRIAGLAPGAHGFHVHEKGNCTAPDASSAGGHFNPAGAPHAGPHSTPRHAGDLGNIIANSEGVAEFSIEVEGLSLGVDAASIIGRALVVHAAPDDLQSQPAGNASNRIACGLISKGP
jgi:Cu-Zn family superoxide dismutase